MSIRYTEVNTDYAEVKPGNRESLIDAVIQLLQSEDSNGNNGAEYMDDYMIKHYGFKSFDEVDEANANLENDEIYCIDKYMKEEAMKMTDKSDKEVIDFLVDFYQSHWNNDQLINIGCIKNKKGQINYVISAYAY